MARTKHGIFSSHHTLIGLKPPLRSQLPSVHSFPISPMTVIRSTLNRGGAYISRRGYAAVRTISCFSKVCGRTLRMTCFSNTFVQIPEICRRQVVPPRSQRILEEIPYAVSSPNSRCTSHVSLTIRTTRRCDRGQPGNLHRPASLDRTPLPTSRSTARALRYSRD